jgi:hypothetical protein
MSSCKITLKYSPYHKIKCTANKSVLGKLNFYKFCMVLLLPYKHYNTYNSFLKTQSVLFSDDFQKLQMSPQMFKYEGFKKHLPTHYCCLTMWITVSHWNACIARYSNPRTWGERRQEKAWWK